MRGKVGSRPALDLRAGSVSDRCACTAARPTRRPLPAARLSRSESRTLCPTIAQSATHASREENKKGEGERGRGRPGRLTAHLEARSDLGELHLFVRRLDKDVVSERDKVAVVDERQGPLRVFPAARGTAGEARQLTSVEAAWKEKI